jgi:hypothetical protein
VSSPYDADDRLMRALAALPPVRQGDAAHREVRIRCRALVERPRQPETVPLEPAAVGTICALYAWQLARIVIG